MRHWRVNLIFVLIFIFGAAVISRLIYLQIIQGELYRALAQGQKIFQPIIAERGEIFFKGGEILATSVKGKYLFISPQEIKEKERTAEVLAQILNLEEKVILEKIGNNGSFEKIKNNLTEGEEKRLAENNLAGVYLGEAIFRKYPQGDMASQVIGFFGSQEQGQYGIEGYYDEVLQVSDIFLTIDYNLQFMAEKLLAKAREDLNIESGQIIILKPNSGKVLALANFPNFDPNYYSEVDDFNIFQNGAVRKLFEPGSAFKPITMAAALDQGKITPQTTYIDEGRVIIGKDIIYNYDKRVWGEKTMTEVLEKSINTGAVFAERQIGHDIFLKYIEQFGFFQPTGIDLQSEVFSENEELKRGYEVNFATASFGQGIEMTPIQLVRGFAAIANAGKLVKPYVVEKIVEDGKTIETQPEISVKQVISQKTASQLTAMLANVVEHGYAKAAKIPGYYIAGKTGTAQVPEKGVYSSNKTWQSFIGFFPAFEPQFLILVKLDNPETKTAEYSAVPLFRDLAKYIIDYYKIPPDYK